jgi:hypothetical protein
MKTRMNCSFEAMLGVLKLFVGPGEQTWEVETWCSGPTVI